MKHNKQAFTLIELLVVVLIIGILAAIAVPQYQKAVEKARMTEAIMAVEKIAQAQQIYKMANGNFTQDITELGIDFSGSLTPYCGNIKAIKTKNFLLAASNCVGDQESIALVQRNPNGYKYVLKRDLSGKRFCTVYSNANNYEKELCQAWEAGH